jgi:hypothetical protein
MHRTVSIANLVQAGIYGAAAFWLKERWGLSAGIAAACCSFQVVGAVAVASGRPRYARWASIASLVGMAVLLGQFIETANHLQEAYGSDARKIGERSLNTVWLAIPWGFFFPIWQAVHGGLKGLIAPALALLFPILFHTGVDEPTFSWPEQPEQKAAAEAAFSLWSGTDATLPQGVGPATVLLTPFENGSPGKAVLGNGKDLAQAITKALDRLDPPGANRPALVLDVARTRYPRKALVPAGDGGGLGKKSGVSPVVAWRPGNIGSMRVAPKWVLPRPKLRGLSPTRFDSVLVDESGTHSVKGAWTAPPEATAENMLAAALAGGRMLARHQTETGSFAYTVRGPSGTVKKKGYNFPRHAGTTWFLTRLALRTKDPEIIKAADLGLVYMENHTTHISGERAYLGDPRRQDGQAWAGTTALAVLAAVAHEHPLAVPWGRFLASSVDEYGQVHGEMDRKTKVFRNQQKNPYGQGQVTLALAALVRAGHDEFRPTLELMAAYMDGNYAPGGVGRLFSLDEHWTCLAALAIKNALGEVSGMEVCTGYLAKEKKKVPDETSRLRPSSGAAGGLAEAVVAGAVLNPEHTDDAIAYGQWFLQSAYNSGDSSLLPKPDALMGGFRDSPYKLDVRMDAVQHIGCALLGIEALMSQTHPGSLP